MRRAFELLALLGDGAEHSGAELSQALGVTRAAVWNQVQRLREAGIEIRGVAGQVQFREDDEGNVVASVGEVASPAYRLPETFADETIRLRPESSARRE